MTGMSRSDHPTLIGLDWGTTSLRAFLFDTQGDVIAARASAHGILQLPAPAEAGGFERAFSDAVGVWLAQHPGLPVVASGMVGSKQGWREAPYVRCPADLDTLAAHAMRVDTGLGAMLVIAPGVAQDGREVDPDVMRGEEIQIAGALRGQPRWGRGARFVLPGTHSKWVEVRAGRIEHFATFMTGEIYSLLLRHSILGRMSGGDPGSADARDAAFREGVRAAASQGGRELTHQLFVVRALGLTGRLAPSLTGDYLSGLLIGHEFAAMRETSRADGVDDITSVLIGEPALVQRYALAASELGMHFGATLENTAPSGLWAFACAAGLLPAAPGADRPPPQAPA